MSEQKTLTTGQAAKICGVSQRTVIRWIDSGHLKGYRFPGTGGHRRIQGSDLVSFLNLNGLPVPVALQYGRRRVLIVEDEAVVSFLMEEVLQGAGYETCVASNGFSAGQLLETFEPDVITLDLNMPGIPGVEVLVSLRKKEKLQYVGILIVSGMPKNELDEALAKGADRALSKPFLNDDLLESVEALAASSVSGRISSTGG